MRQFLLSFRQFVKLNTCKCQHMYVCEVKQGIVFLGNTRCILLGLSREQRKILFYLQKRTSIFSFQQSLTNISAFYPHIGLLSPYPPFIPLSAFYPLILRSCNATVQIVLSIVRSISLFSTTQTVTMACNPHAINSESMNVAPQCERWNFIQ